MALIFKSAQNSERLWIAADVTRQQQHASGGMFCSKNTRLLPQLLFIEWEPVIFPQVPVNGWFSPLAHFHAILYRPAINGSADLNI